MVFKKTFFLIFLALTLFFSYSRSLNVKAVERLPEDDYVIKDKTTLTLHFTPYILKGEVAKFVKDSSLPLFLVQKELKLSQSVKKYLLANSQTLNLIFSYFSNSNLDANKNLENLRNPIVKDQDGKNLNFSVDKNDTLYEKKINFKIKILSSTEIIFLTYRSPEMFNNRGMVNNVYIKEVEIKAEKPLIIKTDIELKAVPFHPDNHLVFSSLKPDKIEDIPYEYDPKKSDGKKYIFSYESLKTFFKNNRYIWLQFGSAQVFEFETKLFIPSSKRSGFLSSIARIPVVLRLPTSSIDTFIDYSSHKPIAWLHDYSSRNEIMFLIPANKDQQLILKGRFQISPINLNLDENYKKRYERATLDQYPRYMADILKKEIESDNPEILSVAKSIKGDKTKVSEIIKATYDFIVKNINYDWISYYRLKDNYEGQSALVTLKKGSGTCGDYSRLMVALLRAQGIPADLVFGTVDVPKSGDELPWHAWVNVNIPNEARLAVDPTWGGSGRDYISQDFDHIPFSYSVNSLLYRFPSADNSFYERAKFSMTFKPSNKLPGKKDLLLGKKIKNNLFIDNYAVNYDPTTILPAKIEMRNLPLILTMFLTDPGILQIIEKHMIWILVGITTFFLVIFFLLKLLIGIIKLIIRKIFKTKKPLSQS